MQCRKLCGFSIIVLLIFLLHDGAETQELRAPNLNERVILSKADREAEVNQNTISEDSVSSKLEELKELPEITPHKCRETKALHRGINSQSCHQHATFIRPHQVSRPQYV